jgi:BlaI family penicillinase repressor
MRKDSVNISEAELEIMKVLWSLQKPVTAQDVSGILENKAWKYSTIATLFSRLVEKGAVSYEKKGRFFYYTPLISEKEYQQVQTKNFVSKLYNGSVKNLVVSLFENQQMSEQDLEELKKRFDL